MDACLVVSLGPSILSPVLILSVTCNETEHSSKQTVCMRACFTEEMGTLGSNQLEVKNVTVPEPSKIRMDSQTEN